METDQASRAGGRTSLRSRYLYQPHTESACHAALRAGGRPHVPSFHFDGLSASEYLRDQSRSTKPGRNRTSEHHLSCGRLTEPVAGTNRILPTGVSGMVSPAPPPSKG